MSLSSSLTPYPSPFSVAVIGGGITGLAAAHRLRELAPDAKVELIEASERLGGVLLSERRDGFLIEHSADNFITNVPWGLDLCRRLGIEADLLPTRSTDRRALVVHRGKVYPVPESFVLLAPQKLWPIVTTPILSWRGKLRLLAEYFVPRRRESGDESLAAFARRRLGDEVFERLVQPLVGGIYTADSTKLSLAATMPRFLEMERRHGSLIRAAFRDRASKNEHEHAASGARYGMFVAPRGGMSQLVDALAARLPCESVHLSAPVESITPRAGGGFSVRCGGEHSGERSFDAVIVTLNAPVAANVLEPLSAPLADDLRKIPYASSAVAVMAYPREQIAHPLDGFGFVVPEIERRPILSVSFSSLKYEGRAPGEYVLLRVFFGGAMRGEQLELSDDELRRLAEQQLHELLGVRGEPSLFFVRRWRGTMPQYHLGHVELVEQILARLPLWRGLELAGNAYHGVGVPNCIHDGEQAAERVLNAFAV